MVTNGFYTISCAREPKARRSVRCLIVPLAIACAVALAPSAQASINYYWGPSGFNNLTPTYPTYCNTAWGYGCAQTGFNTIWDWSGMSKVNGDCVYIGWRDSSGTFYLNTWTSYCSEFNGSEFHITASAFSSLPDYKRAFCAYFDGSSSYVRCWERDTS